MANITEIKASRFNPDNFANAKEPAEVSL